MTYYTALQYHKTTIFTLKTLNLLANFERALKHLLSYRYYIDIKRSLSFEIFISKHTHTHQPALRLNQIPKKKHLNTK